MRSPFALTLLATAIVAGPTFAQTDKGPAGMWQGTVERSGAPQAPMVLRLKQKNGLWKGRADVQGSASPLTKVQVQGNHVQFAVKGQGNRSEEHTSELQSQFHIVCRLLLEKKKKITVLGVYRIKHSLSERNHIRISKY